MSNVRLPLYGKILAWFMVNLAVLALLLLFFLKSQFHLGFDWMLSGVPGDRIAAIGDDLAFELSRMDEAKWDARLQEMGAGHGVSFALFSGDAAQVNGERVEVPAEVLPRLMDRRPPNDRGPRPLPAKRPADAPPKPRFMLRAGKPAFFWAGIHLDLVSPRTGRSLTLVMRSDSITGGGLFFDSWPWIGLAAAALVLSALIWLPVVAGITKAIGRMNDASKQIAAGRFDVRVPEKRADELGELATSVNAMASQLGDYVREQRRITADVAHELCSPIARMQMALGVVEQRGNPEQAVYLQKLDRELQHMAKLVEEVLAFSKAETLPEREMPEDIVLRDLIQSVLAREAPENGVKVEIEDMKLHSLRGALDRATGNVVRNAVRYASSVEIHAKAENGRVIIQILDRGPGVPEEALSRLFEPFFRPEAARGRNTGGSGLGLAIAKRCIEACGGTVTAQNREGGGLVVTITLQ